MNRRRNFFLPAPVLVVTVFKLLDKLLGRYKLAVFYLFYKCRLRAITFLVKIGQAGNTLIATIFAVKCSQSLADLLSVRANLCYNLGQDSKTIICICAHPIHITAFSFFVSFLANAFTSRTCRCSKKGDSAVSIVSRLATDFNVVCVINTISSKQRTVKPKFTRLAGY